MTTKERLFALLDARQERFVSGEELASELNLSRAAVSKAMKALRQEGYAIEAVTNRGYRLSGQGDILSVPGVKKYLKSDFEIMLYPSVTSTNTVLRALAEQGAPEATVVIGGEQTQGRGRSGRSFYSPAGTGVYVSLLLRPADADPRQTVTLTAAAAVALCRAIETVSGSKAQIKWVNDIFLNGKKVSGILSEAAFGLESGVPEYVVIGVGINAYAPEGGFPPGLTQIAGALWDSPVPDGKNKIIAAFLNHFRELYNAGDPAAFLEDYRRRSLVVGKDVIVIAGGRETPARTLGIDESCRLLVRYESGETAALSYGEVRIRT